MSKFHEQIYGMQKLTLYKHQLGGLFIVCVIPKTQFVFY